MAGKHQRSDTAWPAVKYEPREWEWAGVRPRSRADRTFRSYLASVPPHISQFDAAVDGPTGALLEEATLAIASLDTSAHAHLASVAGALLRSESVGSSKIEHLEADARSLALAAIGSAKAKSIASQVWANVEAMEAAIRLGESDEAFGLGTIVEIHRSLMRNDPTEAEWAGRPRTMQSWIGGSDECPRDALFVPPTPDRVVGLLDDLSAFGRRTDLPALVQAAVVHAQFETIHPFTDGNGRTGRALIHTILRRRRITTNVVVPTSAALLADVESYFDSLGSYRAGDLNGYLAHFASATSRAASEARILGTHLTEVAAEWDELARPRPGSIAERLLQSLLRQPVISATNHGAGHVDAAGFYRAVDRLVGVGILTELTDYSRNRLWIAADVTAALDDFNRRIGKRQNPRR